MKIIHPTCIRGNYSEIQALLHNCGTVTGVDAAEDALAEAEETFAGADEAVCKGKPDDSCRIRRS